MKINRRGVLAALFAFPFLRKWKTEPKSSETPSRKRSSGTAYEMYDENGRFGGVVRGGTFIQRRGDREWVTWNDVTQGIKDNPLYGLREGMPDAD